MLPWVLSWVQGQPSAVRATKAVHNVEGKQQKVQLSATCTTGATDSHEAGRRCEQGSSHAKGTSVPLSRSSVADRPPLAARVIGS